MKKELIPTLGGKASVALKKTVFPETEKECEYFSLGNGCDITGVYLTEEAKKALIKFLGGTSGRSTKSGK